MQNDKSKYINLIIVRYFSIYVHTVMFQSCTNYLLKIHFKTNIVHAHFSYYEPSISLSNYVIQHIIILYKLLQSNEYEPKFKLNFTLYCKKKKKAICVKLNT